MQAKKHQKLNVERKAIKITGDTSRVISRLHLPDERYRIHKIIQRIISMPDTTAENLIAQIMADFSRRHEDIGHIFERHLNTVKDYLPPDTVLSDVQKSLIGAYFTKEYSIESAALFNPSIVPHPDQNQSGQRQLALCHELTGNRRRSYFVNRLSQWCP